MAVETKLTVEDCLRGAWQAMLDGDHDTFDKLCAMADRAFHGDEATIPITRAVPIRPTTDH